MWILLEMIFLGTDVDIESIEWIKYQEKGIALPKD
jgi:hypothetical protein